MLQKNWQDLIKPAKLQIDVGRERDRVATVVAEPLERGELLHGGPHDLGGHAATVPDDAHEAHGHADARGVGPQVPVLKLTTPRWA